MHRHMKILKTFLSLWKEFLTEPVHVDFPIALSWIPLAVLTFLLAIAFAGLGTLIIAFGIAFIGIIVFLTVLFVLEAAEIVKIEERLKESKSHILAKEVKECLGERKLRKSLRTYH